MKINVETTPPVKRRIRVELDFEEVELVAFAAFLGGTSPKLISKLVTQSSYFRDSNLSEANAVGAHKVISGIYHRLSREIDIQKLRG
jgi:hypothetical protein